MFHKVCITANGNEIVFPPYRYFLISRKHLAQGLLKVTVEMCVQRGWKDTSFKDDSKHFVKFINKRVQFNLINEAE